MSRLSSNVLQIVVKFFFSQKIVRKRTFFQITEISPSLNEVIEGVCMNLTGLITKPENLTWIETYFKYTKNFCFKCSRKCTTVPVIKGLLEENYKICRGCELSTFHYIPQGNVIKEFPLKISDLKSLRNGKLYRLTWVTVYLYSDIVSMSKQKEKEKVNQFLQAELDHRPSKNELEKLEPGKFYRFNEKIFVNPKQFIGFECPFCWTKYRINGLPYRNAKRVIHKVDEIDSLTGKCKNICF